VSKTTARVAGLLIIGIGALLIPGTGLTQPRITIPQPNFDFGRVAQHNLVTCVYWLKSVGSDTLRITQVVPGCGCTEAPLSDSVIAPGDSAMLRIVFNTRQFRGSTTKKPYVMTNADDEKHYVYLTSSVVEKPGEFIKLQFEPYRVDVSQFTDRPRRRSRFIIRNVSDKDLKLTLIPSGPLNFEVELPGEVKAGEEVLATVLVKKDLLEASFDQSLTVQVNDEVGTRYTIPVRREVRLKRTGS
jgi:hypothetical protein